MEKINLVEILKDCPKDMELDCTMFDNVVFDYVDRNNDAFPIKCHIKLTDNKCITYSFTAYGCCNLHNYAKCVIFPKGRTTWEGFIPPYQFKDGDVIFTYANCLQVGLGNTWISIFQENRNGGVATYVDFSEDGEDYYDYIDGSKGFLCMTEDVLRQRLATKEKKQKLFDAIKANGYKWNAETKTLETLVPNKFDTSTLKPFESKVLVRDSNSNSWNPSFWGYYDKCSCFPYVTIRGNYKYCIPYESNEHLLGTTDDCDEYYKTWEL